MCIPFSFYTTAADTAASLYKIAVNAFFSLSWSFSETEGRQLSPLKRGNDELIECKDKLKMLASNHQEAMQKQKDITSWSTPLLHPTSPPENGKHGSANWLKVDLKIKKA